jgi:hypothetical protein
LSHAAGTSDAGEAARLELIYAAERDAAKAHIVALTSSVAALASAEAGASAAGMAAPAAVITAMDAAAAAAVAAVAPQTPTYHAALGFPQAPVTPQLTVL